MRESRYMPSEFELRGERGQGATLTGYAAIFNSPTNIAGLFMEQVDHRAFNKTIRDGDVRALLNHDPNIVLGRNKARTLRLRTDDRGLLAEIDLPETQMARDLWTSIDRGDISQMSFSFEVVKQSIRQAEVDGGLPLRTLNEVRLFDVSPVTYPAYEDTEVHARAAVVFQSLSQELVELEAEEHTDIRSATTEEPVSEPPQALDATQQPEPAPNGKSIYIASLALRELAERQGVSYD